MSQNAQDIEELVQRINSLTTILEKSKDGGALSPAVLHRLDRLSA